MNQDHERNVDIMSFSSDVKMYICQTGYECPCCRLSELAGFFRFTGRINDAAVKIASTVDAVNKRMIESLTAEVGGRVMDDDNKTVLPEAMERLEKLLNEAVLNNECCQISFLRGAFLGGGSVSDPEKEYHLEFGANNEREANYIISVLQVYGFNPKMTQRKKKEVVYIKESSQIADLIGYLTNGMAGLEVLTAQVEKEIRGNITRQVNCDSANLNKLAKASSRHIMAIKKIKDAGKWESIPEVLREIGELRLENPEASLEALGRMTKQGIGKSGVNHRLNRIIEFAEGLE